MSQLLHGFSSSCGKSGLLSSCGCGLLSAVASLVKHSPSPVDLPDLGIEPGSPSLQVDCLPTELSGNPIIEYYLAMKRMKF